MRNALIYLMFAAIILGAFIMQHLQLTIAEDNAALWKAEAQRRGEEASRWKTAHARAKAGQVALSAQAQACLDRENAARADAEVWQGILADMTLRPMSEQEKTGVPDDATRRALLDALDRPL
ncbi:MAG: hypothetical protein HDQ94_02820 [Desulfovibrio sp.]|nr:hypothetical protein [Desulfovibrio sp.]